MIPPPIPIREHEPMDRHTSWRAGGAARYYAEPASVEEARALAAWALSSGVPLLWAGRGTNTLVRDAGYPGLIAAYRGQAWTLEESDAGALLRVEAGAPMAGLARRLGAMGWAGLEWAEGLPGTVGGAVFGNAGCYGSDTASTLASAEILVGDTLETWPVERLSYGYRTSALKRAAAATLGPQPAPLIVAATFRLTRADPAELAARTAAIAVQRKGKTPSGSSCGSVFKNPPGESAGRLIEAAGLKGQAVGAAVISPLHANYIVNTGGATAAEILELAELAWTTVRERFGVDLELEVRVI